ncbi:MAG TPA: sulfurtransferase complex subunit TusD [Cycloclasticus sp.]|jgi:tRNA 2-thiouridine synthesizing protein D|nr:sulfurtransferase complex subunit TusD [Cycloclasticus sp.]HIL92993.1 sulfurtransferase complex subunit TusD [Cycloclasticus sp.]
MKISVQINASPYQHQAADTAWHFIQAALAGGHEIYRVFFYHDGIYNALRDSRPPGDERDIVKRWSELHVDNNIDLVVCISSAQRRGLLEQSVAKKVAGYEKALADGFRIAGLGLLMEAVIDSERHVIFGE